jgi:hypothetical protein
MDGSAVCSPHSESWVAMERRSLAADSWDVMRVLNDLIRRKRRLESSGWVCPRREEREKCERWGGEVAEVVERLEERIERARFLGGRLVSVCLGGGREGQGEEGDTRGRNGWCRCCAPWWFGSVEGAGLVGEGRCRWFEMEWLTW